MPADPTFPIDARLQALGVVRIASKQQARLALIEVGLTSARKHNMAAGKWDAAIAATEVLVSAA